MPTTHDSTGGFFWCEQFLLQVVMVVAHCPQLDLIWVRDSKDVGVAVPVERQWLGQSLQLLGCKAEVKLAVTQSISLKENDLDAVFRPFSAGDEIA
jgi:hypothetical protein